MKRRLHNIYEKLYAFFGPQHWWPGETPFEVAVGAILTQNTAWANAAKAIHQLKKERSLTPSKLSSMRRKRLARLIRSSGFFNQKAERLQIFVRYLMEKGGSMTRLSRRETTQGLRRELLSLDGIGPETADSILLYALAKPIFVIDAYTKRVLTRHSIVARDASYDELQDLFMSHLPHRVRFFNEYHALFVVLGKRFCHSRNPDCSVCPLRSVGKLRLEASL